MVEASAPLIASGEESQPKTAFVFAGGGSFGAVQVGMLRSLAAHGVTADLVVGSSVGAMNSAYYAGTPTPEGVERLAKIWRGLRRRDVFPITPRVLLGLMRRRDFKELYDLVADPYELDNKAKDPAFASDAITLRGLSPRPAENLRRRRLLVP